MKPYCVERWPTERNGKPQKDKLHEDRLGIEGKSRVKRSVPGSYGVRSTLLLRNTSRFYSNNINIIA